ncbi:hypothetical protein XPA_010634 [Xanthoria parietina]
MNCCEEKKDNNKLLRSTQSRNKASRNVITFLQRTIVNETNIEQRTSDPRARPQSSPLGPVFFTGSRARRHTPISIYTKTGGWTRVYDMHKQIYTHVALPENRKLRPSTPQLFNMEAALTASEIPRQASQAIC